ncbi:MAG TPA: hypothetical protein VFQ20_11355 [Burkholderiaceae bacterium]|nr:hypothetical protein [Burkholderiaceae bacterium]
MKPVPAKPSPLQRAMEQRLRDDAANGADTELDAADMGTAFGLDYSLADLDLPARDDSSF